VTSHDGIKTIQNGVFAFFKKEQSFVSFKKKKDPFFLKKNKKQVGCCFF